MRSTQAGTDLAAASPVERDRTTRYDWCVVAGVALPVLVSLLGTSVSVPPLRR